jgi:hypothetical protein
MSNLYKILALLVLCLALVPRESSALGSIAHRYIATNVMPLVAAADPTFTTLLKNYSNAYFVGADYPDTGYLPGAIYGEISHWPPFVNAFLAHINATYPPYPAVSPRRDIVSAFLLGVCTHIISDITSHWTYYDLVAAHDYPNLPPGPAWSAAHQHMDPATDFYVIVNYHYFDHAVIWWVPISDLVQVYANMGWTNVTSKMILEYNVLYYIVTGLDEDLVAIPAYLWLKKFDVPWGMANLDHPDTPQLRYGAFPGEISDSASYVAQTWAAIRSNASALSILENFPLPNRPLKTLRPVFAVALDFVARALEKGWFTHSCSIADDGTAVISKDCINILPEFREQLKIFTKSL